MKKILKKVALEYNFAKNNSINLFIKREILPSLNKFREFMKIFRSSTTWVAGLAIFSMFFGAGNVVFPLLLGITAKNHNIYANIGLLLTSIGGPLLGLFSSVLFEGNFKSFFCRIGKIPGYLLMIVTSLLLGPLAVMPRCLVVSYSSLQQFIGNTSIFTFSIISAVLIFLMLYKKNNIIPILGFVLSPVLIICLVVIIIKSLFFSGSVFPSTLSVSKAFLYGLVTGYDTMDLIASIFFSVSIWTLLRTRLRKIDHEKKPSEEIKVIIASGCIAGLLLSLIYSGFSFASSFHVNILETVEPEKLLTALANYSLGKILGSIANAAIALACFTTIMGLAVTFSEILRKDFKFSQISHQHIVLALLILTAIFSNLGFKTIMSFIHPAVEIFYPSIIVLTLCNTAYKLFNFSIVKIPFYATLVITVIIKYVSF